MASLSTFRRWVHENLPDEAARSKVTVLRDDVEPGSEAQIRLPGQWIKPDYRETSPVRSATSSAWAETAQLRMRTAHVSYAVRATQPNGTPPGAAEAGGGDTRGMSTPPEPPPSPEPARSPAATLMRKTAYIAAPGTIVFALLYYFGSLYIKAYYTTLGVFPEDLGFSIQGTVASSTNVIFLPLCMFLIGGLISFLALGWLAQRLDGPRRAARRRTAISWLLALGVGVVLVGLVAFVWEVLPTQWAQRFVPALTVAVGATLAVFAVQLRLTTDAGARNRHPPGDRMWLAGGTLLLALFTLSLFYDMTQYVAAVGRGDARSDTDGGYRGTQWVVVHSRVPLAHYAPGIISRDRGPGLGPYRYEYQGFRIIAKAPNRFYLVSHTSRWNDRVVVALPDDGTVWVEIRGVM